MLLLFDLKKDLHHKHKLLLLMTGKSVYRCEGSQPETLIPCRFNSIFN